MAILQIASWTDVYIFDMVTLGEIAELDWSALVDGIFMNSDLLKIGKTFFYSLYTS